MNFCENFPLRATVASAICSDVPLPPHTHAALTPDSNPVTPATVPAIVLQNVDVAVNEFPGLFEVVV